MRGGEFFPERTPVRLEGSTCGGSILKRRGIYVGLRMEIVPQPVELISRVEHDLPQAFAHDPERLSRFQREAKMLASLNHPNIATIHGLEHFNDTSYLVMELVSGETLRDRIGREGPLPVEEALKISMQMAEALEAAHEKGIIHRDLKPANVKVTPEGKVKVVAVVGQKLGRLARTAVGRASVNKLSRSDCTMKKKLDAYRGKLTPKQIAHGMNVAATNAQRLASDAEALLDAKRFPTAASLAILSIEEAGRILILQTHRNRSRWMKASEETKCRVSTPESMSTYHTLCVSRRTRTEAPLPDTPLKNTVNSGIWNVHLEPSAKSIVYLFRKMLRWRIVLTGRPSSSITN